jgi:hypothetical protein
MAAVVRCSFDSSHKGHLTALRVRANALNRYAIVAGCGPVCGAGRMRHRRRTISRRDFVPWRFSDAGRRSAWLDRCCRRPKTCTRAVVSRCSKYVAKTAATR